MEPTKDSEAPPDNSVEPSATPCEEETDTSNKTSPTITSLFLRSCPLHIYHFWPLHGALNRLFSLILIPILIWLTCLSMFGPQASPLPPQGPIFLLIILVSSAVCLGEFFTLIRLPALLGMLIAGIVIRNLPGLEFEKSPSWSAWSSILRGTSLVIILMRAGLALDLATLKKLKGMVFRLAFLPCLAETASIAVAANLILGFPWLWGFLLGFVVANVSPAVVVPCVLQLQEDGFGVERGIPTLVMAAASVDNVLAISGFSVCLGIVFKPDADLVRIILQGPIEALIGLAFGTFWGLLVTFLPGKDHANLDSLRFLFLFGGGLVALFGSKRIEYSGAGALAVLVMAFVAGVGWKRQQGWTGSNPVAAYLGAVWTVFLPILFSLIGAEIQVTSLDGATVGWGLLIMTLGLLVRSAISFISVMGGDLTWKDRLFISLAWIPKATVQAAIGPLALDQARQMVQPREDYNVLGLQVLTIAVLVILVTAPLGAIAIVWSAPKLLLKKEDVLVQPQDVEGQKDELQKEEGVSTDVI